MRVRCFETAAADLETMLLLLVKGGFYHAGQVCVSVQRVYAEADIAEELAQHMATTAKTLKVGDPSDSKADVGPLIHHQESDRVAEWADEAEAAGAKLLRGGNTISAALYAPTVLLNPPNDITIRQNEVFGPVVCVYSYDTIEEVISRAKVLPFSFQASVMTRSIDRALLA